ncbi:hypothetical protein [Marinobacter sp. VGCF2001]|uniref:hypothetical protein n=1 Tax=Marinobacter sp. VGCF2001 TaxID=3417189 RepID=UPI003CF7CA24
MKVNYTSSVTGKRATVHVDQSTWSIFKKTLEITCGARASTDQRLSVYYWVTALDTEYRTWAKDETLTFDAYVSKRLAEEILMDLDAIGRHHRKVV